MQILASAGERVASIFAGLTFRLILIGIILAMFLNTYVEVRIPIPLLPDIHWQGWKPLAIERGKTIDQFDEKQKEAGTAQKGVNDTEQARLDTVAKDSENDKALTDIAVRAAVAEYARTHRVREGGSCPSSRADTTAQGDGPGVAERVPEAAGLVISEPDLQELSDAAGYAVSCHNLFVDIAG